LKTGLLEKKSKECLVLDCLLVFMYLGGYLNGLTSASVTVLRFHEADVNCES